MAVSKRHEELVVITKTYDLIRAWDLEVIEQR
jgi:hypothetical protein